MQFPPVNFDFSSFPITIERSLSMLIASSAYKAQPYSPGKHCSRYCNVQVEVNIKQLLIPVPLPPELCTFVDIVIDIPSINSENQGQCPEVLKIEMDPKGLLGPGRERSSVGRTYR